jgi:DNA polymerase-3 subunit alpha
MLDGAARVGPLMQAAAAEGMPAIAMTDHGNMFGAYDFWKQATANGVKPIIGTEAYITPGTHRGDRTRAPAPTRT